MWKTHYIVDGKKVKVLTAKARCTKAVAGVAKGRANGTPRPPVSALARHRGILRHQLLRLPLGLRAEEVNPRVPRDICRTKTGSLVGSFEPTPRKKKKEQKEKENKHKTTLMFSPGPKTWDPVCLAPTNTNAQNADPSVHKFIFSKSFSALNQWSSATQVLAPSRRKRCLLPAIASAKRQRSAEPATTTSNHHHHHHQKLCNLRFALVSGQGDRRPPLKQKSRDASRAPAQPQV